MSIHTQMALHMQQHEIHIAAEERGYILCDPDHRSRYYDITHLVTPEYIITCYAICPICLLGWNILRER